MKKGDEKNSQTPLYPSIGIYTQHRIHHKGTLATDLFQELSNGTNSAKSNISEALLKNKIMPHFRMSKCTLLMNFIACLKRHC